MREYKKGFTLVEVLISITLFSLVLMALYKSASILRSSNSHLFEFLQKSNNSLKGSRTLYRDILYADSNISITTEDKLHRLTLNNTRNSLYGQSHSKVVWLVHKENNTLLRIEGGEYDIPLRNEQKVEIDAIAEKVELFKIYQSKKKNKLLVMLKIKGQEPQLFMTQNTPTKPPKKKKNNQLPNAPKNIIPNTQNPFGG